MAVALLGSVTAHFTSDGAKFSGVLPARKMEGTALKGVLHFGYAQSSSASSQTSDHIEFKHFHPEYRRYIYRCRRNPILGPTGTRYEHEIPCNQDFGFLPQSPRNAAHYLNEEKTKL
jgi:hypothetical protein